MEGALSDMTKIDTSSPAEKRISCKMVTETSSIDWKFNLSETSWFLNSEVFSDGRSGCKWRISHCYLTTDVEELNMCIHTLFLELMSKPKRNILAEVQVKFRPGINKTLVTASSKVTFTVGPGYSGCVIARFQDHAVSFCVTCQYLICKCAEMSDPLFCRVTVSANYPKQEAVLDVEKFKGTILANLVSFCNYNDFDTKIVVKSAVIPAHRIILAARSKVFPAMFQHEMQETKSDIINIVDFDEETIRHLVDFLYTSSLTKDDTELLLKLLMASDKYDIGDLRDMCESMLILKMDTSNVVDILKQAVLLDSLSNLRNVAIELLSTDLDYFSAELKEKLVPINTLFIEIERMMKPKCFLHNNKDIGI